jgi:hypothetical protein
VRYVLSQQIDHSDRPIAAWHSDMHVQSEHDSLIGQPSQPVHDFFIPFTWEHGTCRRAMERMSSAHCQLESQRSRNITNLLNARKKLISSVVDCPANPCFDLKHGLHQLGGRALDRFFFARLQDSNSARCQIARFAIEDLQFNFHSQHRFAVRPKYQFVSSLCG